MIRDKAQEIFELLKQEKGLPEEKVFKNPSLELNKIISIILGECNCSLTDENGNYVRYGSSIDIKIVEEIIKIFISDQTILPKSIVSKALAKEGIRGIRKDIKFEKKYNIEEDIPEIIMEEIVTNDFLIHLGENNTEVQEQFIKEILSPYVKQIIFENRELSRKSPIATFIKKLRFKPKTTKEIIQDYIKILKKHTKEDEKIIENSANYMIKNILQNKMFKQELIERTLNATELQILGRIYSGFTGLVNNMVSEVIHMIRLKESPNNELEEIKHIYYIIVTILKVLVTDLKHMNKKEIINKIEEVNRNFNFISNNQESLYRTKYLDIDQYSHNVKFVNYQDIQKAMKNLSEIIQELITNANNITNTAYTKEVMRINYRFIRIQPFKSANGRTSRALINMLLAAKGMSAYFEREHRMDYIKSINDGHLIIAPNELEYLNALVNSPSKCAEYELEYLKKKIPLLIVKD